MYSDPSGLFWEELFVFIRDVFTEAAPAYAAAGEAAAIDGPIPVGDIIGGCIAAAATIYVVGKKVVGSNSISIPKSSSIAYSKEKEAEKEKINNKPPQIYGTYYHATSLENANLIMLTGTMVGSRLEGGFIFAWRSKPSLKALENSGASKYEVIIRFETATAFEKDPGISNPKVLLFGPVRSCRPGPIKVKNVEIVETLWKN